MGIQHEVVNSAFKPCAQAAVNGESCARNFSRRRGVENFEVVADIPVRFGGKAELGRRKVSSYFLVFGIVFSYGYGFVGNVGNGQQRHFKIRLGGGKLSVQLLDFVAHFFHARNDFRRVFFLLFKRGNLSGFAVALGFQHFHFLQNVAALAIKLKYGVHVVFAASGLHGVFDEICVFHNKL